MSKLPIGGLNPIAIVDHKIPDDPVSQPQANTKKEEEK